MNFISSLFRRPTPLELAKREYEESQRELLRMQSICESAISAVESLDRRIQRLGIFIRSAG